MRRVILDAAIEVLLTDGAHEVTARRVADHADVARTTIYRHWPDQASLLLATIDALTEPHQPAASVGDLAHDLSSALQSLRSRLLMRDVRSVFGAIAAYAGRDGAFADAQQRFVQQLTRPTVSALEAAQERGQLAAGIDAQFEATVLAGPILYQHLVRRGDLPDGFVDQILTR